MTSMFSVTFIMLSFLAGSGESFVPRFSGNPSPSNLFSSTSSPPIEEIKTMRLREIQSELKELGVSYQDCFDKESLINRLVDAREAKEVPRVDERATKPTAATSSTTSKSSSVKENSSNNVEENQEEILADLRSQSIKELKLACSRRNMRYFSFLEKEDFVQAIFQDMLNVASFSASGALRPGTVGDLTSDQLDDEMTNHETPMLVDVYATWCGPCKMMAPEMDKLAEELQGKCRVAKIDSDKHPEWAGRYKVQGLPTTLLIVNGEVQDRKEGAFMKAQLMDFVKPHL